MFDSLRLNELSYEVKQRHYNGVISDGLLSLLKTDIVNNMKQIIQNNINK